VSDDNEMRCTQRVWEADLGEQGRKLTLDELRALEAMHQCQQLREILEATRMTTRYLASIEGRIDRLETYLIRIDPRYPRTERPIVGVLVAPEAIP
jgi:hypothetical protein